MLESAIQDTWKHLLLYSPIILGFLVIFFGSLYSLFANLREKHRDKFVFVLLIVSILGLAYFITEIVLFNYDIQHETYSVSYAEFYYDPGWGNNEDTFEFSDDFDLFVRGKTDLGITEGTYTGYLLYCKNSRWVLAYSKTPFE